ncbi:MAG TPA: ATP-binding protein [Methanocorpusculum sp.]|nr:ATP-binding protein [Methanocorpusculum sp.]
MEIRRDAYLQQLIERQHNGLIKVVTGLRRVGKSYLLNTIFYQYLLRSGIDEDHIIRIAFDNPQDEVFTSPKELYTYIRSRILDSRMYYVILDEVQLLQNFETTLNGLLYQNNVDVYVTGSNSKFLSTDVITEFRGRGDEVHVYPLSFAEFMSVYPKDKYEGLTEYLMYGGLPPVILRDGDRQKEEYLKTLFRETYLKDIISRNKIRNTPVLETLVDILASQIGSLTNPRRIIDTFRSVEHVSVSPNTIQAYLTALEEAYIISCAKRYNIRGRQYIGSPQKYYFEDNGLRNARLNFRQYEDSYLLENSIYTELRRRGFNVDVGSIDTYESNAEKKSVRKHLEVDFVANCGSKRYYIQSALTLHSPEKVVQEKKSLKTVADSFKKIIVTGDIVKRHTDENGIVVMSVYDFLLDAASLDA